LHWAEAGHPAVSAVCFIHAGEAAAALCDLDTAAGCFHEALHQANLADPDTPIKIAVGQPTSIRDAILRARRGQADLAFTKGELGPALQTYETLRQEARSQGLWLEELRALLSLVTASSVVGWVEEAERWLTQAHLLLEEHRDITPSYDLAQVSYALMTHARQKGHFEQAAAVGQHTLVLYRQLGFEPAVAATLDALASIHLERSELSQAIDLYTEALALHRKVGHRLNEAITAGNLGMVHMRVGRFTEAQDLYGQALALQRQLNNTRGMAQSLRQIGTLHVAQNRPEQALDCFHQALDIAQTLQDPLLLARVHTTLAQLAQVRADFTTTLHHQKQAEELYRDRLGDLRQATLIVSQRGEALAAMGEPEQALAVLQMAYDHHREQQRLHDAAWPLIGVADMHRKLGRLDQALHLTLEAQRLLASTPQTFHYAIALIELGLIALARHNIPEAERIHAQVTERLASPDAAASLPAALQILTRALELARAGQHDSLHMGEPWSMLTPPMRRTLQTRFGLHHDEVGDAGVEG
ncbi:MAG: tetratricopeptide repeat protein, partial [Myxococcota bacterium]